MAISLTQRTDLITALVGLFDAAPSSQLMTAFVGEIENGTSVDDMVNMWTSGAEFTSLYPVWLTNEEFARNFVDSLLGDNVTAANKTLGADFLVSLINGGATQGEAALAGIRFIAAQDVNDADWGQAAQALLNKVDVATYFATTKDVNNATFAELQAVTAGVTAESSSVSDKKILIDADLDSAMQILTTGQDRLTGSAGNDGFLGWIFDNQNTAQSGDYINGGAGRDTLSVELGNSQDFAISLKTESVEVAEFRAQSTDSQDNDNDGADNEVTDTADVSIDAQDMNGTVEFWSTNSRADLRIEDVRNNSHETKLGFRDTDAGDVDYNVFFDSQHITAPDGTTSDSQLFLELLDLEAAAATGDKLTNNFYVGVRLTVGGTEYEIVGTDPITTTYADLVAALNAALQAQGLTTITASLGEEFNKFNADDGLQYSGTQIVLTNSGPEALEGIGWVANGTTPADTNIHTAIEDAAPSTTTALTQVDVVFDNVGRGSQSGDFLAGNMSLGTNSGSKGIQQFNVEVQRDSWVKSVSTTNNSLEVVNVVNATGYDGDIRIGANDGSTGLEDVRVFNAETMAGKVTLQADLDEDIIAKYDNLKDGQSDAAADNIAFEYKTGGNDDTVTISLSEEAASYEDMTLTVQTNAGNDNVTLTVDDDVTPDLDTNWAADQAALNNIVIDTGAGNDTVRAFGDGEVTISTGTGNDTVYSDNSGINNTQAAWVFNGNNSPALNDILGEGAGSDFFLYNPKLTVTFSSGSTGAGVTAADAVANDNGFESTVDINLTDFVGNRTALNQALKSAINSDETLSKFLKAEDGPNNSVIVTSLVDGLFNVNDLDVNISQGTLPGSSDASFAAVNDAWKAFQNDSTATVTNAALATQLTNAQGATGYNGTSVLVNGVSAVQEVFTATFAGDENGDDTTIVFDGVTVTLDTGNLSSSPAVADLDSATNIATEFAAQYNANGARTYNAVDNADGTVTFTSIAGGTRADVVAADFVVTANTVDGTTVDVTAVNVDTQGVDAVLSGTASDEEANDNTINVGAGNDVVALSTNAQSNETIVFTGLNQGNVDILNFTAGNVAGSDVLDFSSYFATKTSASNSSASEVSIATSLNADATAEANSVTVIDFTAGTGNDADETFAALTASDLLTALNNANTGTNNYGNIADATLDATGAVTNLVGDVRDHIVMVHNEANDGEYKVFKLTSSDAAQTGATNGDFSAAELIGVVDLGEDAAFNLVNFA